MSYTHLTEDERYHIHELLRQGYNQKAIALELGRSASTLSRKLQRNKGQRGRRPRQAGMQAIEKLSGRGKNNVNRVSESAWEYAVDKLTNEQWSPEQITGRQKKEKVDSISHESIYQRSTSPRRRALITLMKKDFMLLLKR